MLDKLKGNIDQLPQVNSLPEDVSSDAQAVQRTFHVAKSWLRAHWLAWKVEFTASRLVTIILHAPSRDVAMGLLSICRFRIGQMPASASRDALYIYTDRAVNRVEDRFGGHGS